MLSRALIFCAVMMPLWGPCTAATPALQGPPPDSPPRVTISVDPRVELMSIIFRLAGNREYNMARVPAYADAVDAHFGEHREHPVVEMAGRLRNTRGVSYDAVMSMAVHLSGVPELEEREAFDDATIALDARWPREDARRFLEHARDFIRVTDFEGFLQQHQALCGLAETRMTDLVRQHADLAWFERFFGEGPQADFSVIIGLLNGGGNYGPKFIHADGTESLYAIIGVWLLDDEGRPRFDESVLPTLVHEFCHSYANHLIEGHREALRAPGEAIFAHVEQAMRRQAYGNWETMFKESLVRACVVRYALDHGGEPAAQRQVAEEHSRGFSWTADLAALLGEYAANREEFATLHPFMGRIVAFFAEEAPRIAAAAAQQREEANRPRVVSIDPANGAVGVDPGVERIVITFDRPMRRDAYSVMLGEGGRERFPEVLGAEFDASGLVFTMRVRLEPNTLYQYALNSEAGGAFRSADGVRLEHVAVAFRTGDGE